MSFGHVGPGEFGTYFIGYAALAGCGTVRTGGGRRASSGEELSSLGAGLVSPGQISYPDAQSLAEALGGAPPTEIPAGE
jgi:hypothetical protein